MIYSQACGYCLTALCRLRLVSAQGPVRVAELCRVKGAVQDDLPAMFVAKIFQDLVRSGILASVRGRNGGFAFARPPAKIRVADIVEAVDGVGGCRMCISGMPLCDERQPCPLHDRFAPIRRDILRFMQETTLEDLSESLAAKMRYLGMAMPVAACEGACTPVSAGPAAEIAKKNAKEPAKESVKQGGKSVSLGQMPSVPAKAAGKVKTRKI